MKQKKPGSLPQSGAHKPNETTQILPFSSAQARRHAFSLLDAGEVIALPTDTVYGLFCRHDSERGLRRLYEVKDRPQEKAIPILIGDQDQLGLLIGEPLTDLAQALISRFWPGPLSIVILAHPTLSPILTANQHSVAIRMPDHDRLRKFMGQSGPLAATSANLSGQPETHTAAEVAGQLGHRIPLILQDNDEDRTARSLPSTVIDLSDPQTPRILRPGPLATQVEEAIRDQC